MRTTFLSTNSEYSLSDFPHEKPNRHTLPDCCRSSWRYGVSWGADFQKGLTAYQRGDYATALREWTPLAKHKS